MAITTRSAIFKEVNVWRAVEVSFLSRVFGLLVVVLCVFGCSDDATLPPIGISASPSSYADVSDYLIGPGDALSINVWHNSELTGPITVRPDGRISLPLIGEVVAAGQTPAALAKEIQTKLAPYVKDPIVTISPTTFNSPYSAQVRVIGEAVQPHAVPYSTNMTLVDVMISVGGLTKYADGDRAIIVRVVHRVQRTYHVHLDSLIRDGDVDENVAMQPGDVLIIPQRFF
jgi:polysaccharide export outer membrane protein